MISLDLKWSVWMRNDQFGCEMISLDSEWPVWISFPSARNSTVFKFVPYRYNTFSRLLQFLTWFTQNPMYSFSLLIDERVNQIRRSWTRVDIKIYFFRKSFSPQDFVHQRRRYSLEKLHYLKRRYAKINEDSRLWIFFIQINRPHIQKKNEISN